MASEAPPIDVETMPDLAELAREVARTGEPRRLRDNGKDIAVIAPARPHRRKRKTISLKAIEAALAAAGTWKELIDPEEFRRQRRELQYDDREPRTW